MIGHPFTGHPYRGYAPDAPDVHFALGDVVAWGRVDLYGDARSYRAARLNDGRILVVVINEQSTEDALWLKRHRVRFDLWQVTTRWVRTSRDLPVVINWPEGRHS